MKPENKATYDLQPIDEDKPGLGQHVSLVAPLFAREDIADLCSIAFNVQSELLVAYLWRRADEVDTTRLRLRCTRTSRAKYTSEIHATQASGITS